MTEADQNESVNHARLQRQLYNANEVQKYCKPQYLRLYRPDESGIRYKVLGLFDLPEELDPQNPRIYTVLASVLPPGEPYKPKPTGTMFGANYFAEVDFERSRHVNQFFKKDIEAELVGLILKLKDKSVLFFDIKKMDLKTGEISDYGFAMQPLIHILKNRAYLIGGRYQMPVYKGKIPNELLN